MISEGRVRVCDNGKTQVDGLPTQPANVEMDGTRFVRHGVRTAGNFAW